MSAPTHARSERLPLPSAGTVLTVLIDGMDDEGRGRALIGDDDDTGYELAVRGAFPGDLVHAEVERLWVKRRLIQAQVVEIEKHGPARDRPACRRARLGITCGGCPLEGALPSFAAGFKRARIEIALQEAGLDLPVDDVRSSAFRYGRRQKVKLMVGGRPSELHFGLYRPHSHILDNAMECPYHHVALNEALEQVGIALSDAQGAPCPPVPGGIKAVIARVFREGVGAVIVSGAPLDEPLWSAVAKLVDEGALASATERVDDGAGNSIVGGTTGRREGPARLTPLEGGPPVGPDAFCQPDPHLARELYAEIAAWALEDGKQGWFLDAYAGTGGFARALLDGGAERVVAIERAAPCLEALAEIGAEAVADEVAPALAKVAGSAPSAVIADPPRKGLADDADTLAGLGAPRLALVSCAPEAMARDLKRLIDAGYRVERIVPWDLFSGTAQIEAVSFLRR